MSEVEAVIKTEVSSHSPRSSSPISGVSASDPSERLSESKLSPNLDEQELIDITTVKAEDSAIVKNEVGDSERNDTCSVNKNENGGNGNIDMEESITTMNTPDATRAQSSPPFKANSAEQRALTQESTSATQSAMETNITDNLQVTSSNSTTNFEEIQNQLKKTLDHIEQRHMVSGFRTLSNATSAVVEHCEQLGLTSDDHPYNAIDREQFWAGLNNCWLYALAQRHDASSDDEKMTDQQLCHLRERVVTWADKLERYGLVDYEMGWWEADILAAMDAILATNYASAQAVAQAAVAKAAAALFGDEANS